MSDLRAMTLPHAANYVADVLLRLSIPLYLSKQGRPWLCGTGFIVKATRGHYLVSAAHVLDDAKERGLFFFSGPSQVRHVTGRLCRSSNRATRHLDPFDIVVVKLDGGDMPPYAGVDKHAVDVSWLRPHQTPRREKMYLVIGFPQSKARVSSHTYQVEVTSCPFRDYSVEDDDYPALGLDSNIHLAVRMNLKKGADPDGKHRAFPKPQGISGAAIFELWDDNAQGDPKVFPVVAVAVEYWRRERLMIGTDSSIVLDMIQKFESE